ncbi:MAG TPA: type II secretion system protein GspC [Gammaproteobacteria bacterium]|nr:type II secretion system protein GspC [Gammaproteobacteria bacterium]
MKTFIHKLKTPRAHHWATELQALQKSAPVALSLLFLLACGQALSQLTWLLIPAEEVTNAAPIPVPAAVAPRQQSQQKIQQLTQAHLLGRYQPKMTAAASANAPDTQMNLTLKGVLAGGTKIAFAIIAQGQNGPEDFYGIGDQLSGAILREVHADRVILERNGRFETLRLPEEFGANSFTPEPDDSGSAMISNPSSPGEVLSNIRQKVLRNPTAFGEYAIPLPYNENGRLRGYKLQPQGDTSLFDAVGLTADDVILEINGVELNDPTKGIKALRSLQRAKSIDAKVLRNGVEIPMHIDVP